MGAHLCFFYRLRKDPRTLAAGTVRNYHKAEFIWTVEKVFVCPRLFFAGKIVTENLFSAHRKCDDSNQYEENFPHEKISFEYGCIGCIVKYSIQLKFCQEVRKVSSCKLVTAVVY